MSDIINNVVFFGPVGTGKTTVFNSLTGKNCVTSSRGSSCTRFT